MALVWPIWSRVITTPSTLVRYWDFLDGISVGFQTDFCHVQTHHTWFKPPAGYSSWLVASHLHNKHLPASLCHDSSSVACCLFRCFITLNATVVWHPAETDTCRYRLVPRRIRDMATDRVLSIFPSIVYLQDIQPSKQQHHVVRVPCADNTPVPGLWLWPQQQGGAIVWESFGQVVASCFNILEMGVELQITTAAHTLSFILDPLVQTLSRDPWLLWYSLNLDWVFLKGSFANSFIEFVPLCVTFVCSWQKAGCPQGTDQFPVDLCRGHGCQATATIGKPMGHASYSIWPVKI